MSTPLVSVVIITYNSGKYILDGLESIKAQTYHNIELIVSDDCSTDNTIDICKQWIEKNGSRFVNCKLITAEHNTGVAGNLNRGIAAATGEWIKSLSGDDKFFSCTIEEYVNFVTHVPDAEICFAKLKLLGKKHDVAKVVPIYNNIFNQIRNPNKQYLRYLKDHYIPGPGLFFKRKIWENIGGYDERYQFCEEYPFNLAVLKQGNVIYYIDKELYGYTIREGSLSNSDIPNFRNLKDQWLFSKEIKIKEQLKHGLILHALRDYSQYQELLARYYSESTLRKTVYVKILPLFSPLHLKMRLKKAYLKMFHK